MAKPDIESYLKLVESQHASKPVFMAVLRLYLEAVDAATQLAVDIPEYYNLSNEGMCQADRLDRLGEMVGVTRAYPYVSGSHSIAEMDDDTFRLIIGAKIMSNSWDGTYASFRENWDNIFGRMGGGRTATYIDGMNMSCSVMVGGLFTDEQRALLTGGYIFPKTMGVGIAYSEDPRVSDTAIGYAGAALLAIWAQDAYMAENVTLDGTLGSAVLGETALGG